MTWLDIVIRLGLSVLIGLVIGLERERHHRPAGMKTHIMVCMGAAIVSMIQLKLFDDTLTVIKENPEMASALKADLGRMGAQVISGIGFLGAGTILVKKGSVQGLTTAATLWLTACIGLAVGMGYYFLCIGGFVTVMIVLVLLRFFQRWQFANRIFSVEIELSQKKAGMDSVREICAARGVIIESVSFNDEPSDEGGEEVYHALYQIRLPRTVSIEGFLQDLLREPCVLKTTQLTE